MQFVDKNAKDGAEVLLRRSDANSDGEVQLGEAVSLLSREHGAGSEQEVQEVKGAFTAADEDASKGLMYEELASALQWCGAGGGYLIRRGAPDAEDVGKSAEGKKQGATSKWAIGRGRKRELRRAATMARRSGTRRLRADGQQHLGAGQKE